MPEYRLSLDFTAADDAQAERLALAWADTCAAEYGTRYAGFERLTRDVTAEVLAGVRTAPWCPLNGCDGITCARGVPLSACVNQAGSPPASGS